MLQSRIQGADAHNLPPPSAELDIIAALVHAHLETLSPKKRALFLSNIERLMRRHEALANVTRIRPAAQDEAKARARAQAFAWVRMAVECLNAFDEMDAAEKRKRRR